MGKSTNGINSTNFLLNDINTNTLAKNHRANIGWSVECRNGDIPGATMISLIGRNPIADNSGERVLFPYDATDDPPDVTEIASARILSFASSSTDDDVAGTGITTLRINGLDANYVPQTEDIIMTGQTEVDSVNTYIAINQMFSLITGSTNFNVGNIYCSDDTDTFTSGVPDTRNYHTMEKEWNVSFTGIYTVPIGCRWFPCKYSSVTSGTSTKFAVSQIDARLAEGLPMFRLNEFTNNGGPFDYDLNGVIPVEEKGVWILRGESSAAATVSILVYVQACVIDLSVYNI